ncbi:hypothetical protein GEW_09879, partial [Pasteurella multocida subsp. gallicida str. Anand1_poultry]
SSLTGAETKHPKKSIDCMQYDVYPTFTKYPSKKSMRYLQKAKNH